MMAVDKAAARWFDKLTGEYREQVHGAALSRVAVPLVKEAYLMEFKEQPAPIRSEIRKIYQALLQEL